MPHRPRSRPALAALWVAQSDHRVERSLTAPQIVDRGRFVRAALAFGQSCNQLAHVLGDTANHVDCGLAADRVNREVAQRLTQLGHGFPAFSQLWSQFDLGNLEMPNASEDRSGGF